MGNQPSGDGDESAVNDGNPSTPVPQKAKLGHPRPPSKLRDNFSTAAPIDTANSKRDAFPDLPTGPPKDKKDKKTQRLNKGELAKFFIIKEKLGAGNFATVRRVIRKKDKQVLAAKIISKKHLKRDELASLGDEVRILREMKHKHIVYLVEMFDTQKHLYLVMNYVQEASCSIV